MPDGVIAMEEYPQRSCNSVLHEPRREAVSPFRAPVRAPDMDELETLVACATDGSLAAAGRRLGTTRSAISITSVDTGVVYEANHALCALLGRDRGELVGHQATARSDWYASDERLELLERIRADGVARGFISRLIRANGSESVTSAS